MKALTDSLHPLKGPSWEGWIEGINTPINKYLDDDGAVSNVVNVWTSVEVAVGSVYENIYDDLRGDE